MSLRSLVRMSLVAVVTATLPVCFVAVPAGATTPLPVAIISAPSVTAVPEVQLSAYDAIWVLSQTEDAQNPRQYTEITKIDRDTDVVVARLNLGYDSVGGNYLPSMTSGANAIWVVDLNSNQLIKIDPATDRVERRAPTGFSPFGVAFADHSVWVAHVNTSAVWRYNPGTLRVIARIPVGNQHEEYSGIGQVSAGDGAVWVDKLFEGKVLRIDAATENVTTIDVAPAPTCGRLVFVPGGFWISDTACSNRIYRYDFAAKRVTAHIDFPNYCDFQVAYRFHRLWATYAPRTDPSSGDCVGGRVAKYDPTTGAQTDLRRAPGAGPLIVLGDHTMWFGDFHFFPPLRRAMFHAATF